METLSFAARLSRLLTERGLYPTEAERITGVSRQKIYAYMNGTASPSLKNLIRLAKGLKVSVDWLCGMK